MTFARTIASRLSRRVPALLLLAGLMAGTALPARAASFDCGSPKLPDEKAICVNRDLSELDVKMATLLDVLTRLVPMGQRGEIQDAQRAFLAYRATCKNRVTCIRKAYEGRIDQLNTGLQAIYARGPF